MRGTVKYLVHIFFTHWRQLYLSVRRSRWGLGATPLSPLRFAASAVCLTTYVSPAIPCMNVIQLYGLQIRQWLLRLPKSSTELQETKRREENSCSKEAVAEHRGDALIPTTMTISATPMKFTSFARNCLVRTIWPTPQKLLLQSCVCCQTFPAQEQGNKRRKYARASKKVPPTQHHRRHVCQE